MMIDVRLLGLKGEILYMTTNIAKMIDHTVLKADTTKEQIETLCEEAKEYKFASVCVNPTWVETASRIIKRYRCKSMYSNWLSIRSKHSGNKSV